MARFDIIVVGAGIMGATIGQALRAEHDLNVLIVDDGKPLSGTRPSGGCIKPSKLTGLDTEQHASAMSMLDYLWGLNPIKFVIRPSGGFVKVDTHQIDMSKVFGVEKMAGDVLRIIDDPCTLPKVEIKSAEGEVTIDSCELLVVAAGMGCAKLLPDVFPAKTLTAKHGVSFQFEGSVEQPFVQAWAPYKQITIHNINVGGEERIWASDGSALKPDNWTDERTQQCLQRVSKAFGADAPPVQIVHGLRPFHKDKPKPCFLEEISDCIWVATGAGKFGCISAGWAAAQMLEVW